MLWLILVRAIHRRLDMVWLFSRRNIPNNPVSYAMPWVPSAGSCLSPSAVRNGITPSPPINSVVARSPPPKGQNTNKPKLNSGSPLLRNHQERHHHHQAPLASNIPALAFIHLFYPLYLLNSLPSRGRTHQPSLPPAHPPRAFLACPPWRTGSNSISTSHSSTT